MATVPFVGSALGQLGRSFALNQTLTVSDLRRRLVARWGETSTVRAAAGKTVTSLRRLGVVEGGGPQPVTSCTPLPASPHASAWLTHALILSRQSESIEAREATTAPELFWTDPATPHPDYPNLELHTEAQHRQIWTPTQP